MSDNQDIKIAVLESEVQGLREQHKSHKVEIKQALDNFSETFTDSINDIRDDLKEIFAFINRSKGGIATLLFSATISGGIVAALISALIAHYWH